MSKINPAKFTLEDFKEYRDLAEKLFPPLNQFINDVFLSYRNGLTIEDNLNQEIKEIKYVNHSSNFPLRFKTKFNYSPKGVLPIYCFNNTLGTYSTQTPWVVWTYNDGQIVISDISGLTTNSTYTIRFLVIYN